MGRDSQEVPGQFNGNNQGYRNYGNNNQHNNYGNNQRPQYPNNNYNNNQQNYQNRNVPLELNQGAYVPPGPNGSGAPLPNNPPPQYNVGPDSDNLPF